MKLEQLQQDFIHAIFNVDRETALKYIEGDDRLVASERLGIYRGSVHGILTQSLGDTFPVCKQLLGKEFFDKMSDRFIDKHPPSTPFFSQYGDELAKFLSEFEPVKTIPFIADVAEFEWARHLLWQKIPAKTFDFSQMATLSEAQQSNIIFHLSPTLHLFKSNYRVDLIWFAHQDNSDIDLESIDINAEIKLAMWKADNAIKIANYKTEAPVSDEVNFSYIEYWSFLRAISENASITELAEKFKENFPELLNNSVKDGWVTSFTSN